MAGSAREIILRWTDRLVFEGVVPGRAPITVDGDGRDGPSPVELLLLAAAGCSAADVVTILQKQRVALRSLEVGVHGTRREQPPRRFTAIHFRFTIAGDGADDAKARHAIDLSLKKYCSVMATLAPDTSVTYDVALA